MAMEVAITLRTSSPYDSTVGVLIATEAVERVAAATNYAAEVVSKTVTNLSPGMDVAVVVRTLGPYDSTVAGLIAPRLASWLAFRTARPVTITVQTVTDISPYASGDTTAGISVYSWNFTSAADRALWVPVGSFRKTYGNVVDEDGRTVLGVTVAQHSPAPTSFTTANSTFAIWQGPIITLAEGDLVDFTCVCKWAVTGNSLDPVETDAVLGPPGYSMAADKNGTVMRAYPSLLVDTNFIQNTNVEPSTRKFVGWLVDLSWHTLKSAAVADSAGTLSPTINLGPLWASTAGVFYIGGVVITVTSRNQ